MAERVLLLASNFAPVRGGSAIVYESLARHAGGRIVVMAPRLAYTDGLPLIGWREHDRLAPYRVRRRRLLRSVMSAASSPPGVRARAVDALQRTALLLAVLREAIRSRARTICVGELLASAWLLPLLRRIPGMQVVAYVHGEEITTGDSYDPDGARRRRALRAADHVIVVSRFTGQAVAALVPECAGRISLIENGVDTARFHPGPAREDLRALYGLGAGPVFVSVCRLLEKKGIDQAIRAFARLHAERPELRFLVVGAGPYDAALRDLAASLGVAGAVVFAGDVPASELADHYRLADAFVMPNRALPNGDTEGFGLVFLEANACGLPVIAGRDGGSTDAVRHGVNGLVVDGACVPDIAAAMRALLDPALRASLATQAAPIVAASDWRCRAEAFLAVCDGLRAGPGH